MSTDSLSSIEKKRLIIQKVKEGHRLHMIGDELGVTKQYVSAVWKQYEEKGEEAFVLRKRGRRKTVPLKKSEVEQVRRLVTEKTPQEMGFKGNQWGIVDVETWIRRSFDHNVVRSELRGYFEKWGVTVREAPKRKLPEMRFGRDYYDYINSDTYKKIAEREEKLKDVEPSKPRRGRPPKVKPESEEDDFGDLGPAEWNEEELAKVRSEMLKYGYPSEGKSKRGKFSKNQKVNFQKAKKKKKKKKR